MASMLNESREQITSSHAQSTDSRLARSASITVSRSEPRNPHSSRERTEGRANRKILQSGYFASSRSTTRRPMPLVPPVITRLLHLPLRGFALTCTSLGLSLPCAAIEPVLSGAILLIDLTLFGRLVFADDFSEAGQGLGPCRASFCFQK